MPQTIQSLHEQFSEIAVCQPASNGAPPKVTFIAGRGGLPCIHINTPQATANIYLHGAHVTSFQPRGSAPVLFMSEKSWFEPGKPLRGGVPICFPWFGPKADQPQLPAHGFARLKPWELVSIDERPDGSIELLLMLHDDEQTRAIWPYRFELGHRITVGHRLTLSLEMRNTDQQDCLFEEALHTYFTVQDIHQVTVQGLKGSSYRCKVQGGVHTQQDDAIAFTGETDRVYDSQANTVIRDPSMVRQIHVDKSHSDSTVVWNPWIAKAQAMPDFGDEEWPGMVCVETANVGSRSVALPPGGRHAMTVTLGLEPL